jgi:aspartate/methionine/tyrosine aminotransferase
VNETYREFTFERPSRSWFTSGEDVVVTCSTMTKFYGLGRLRVGWILADRTRARELTKAKKLISGHDSEYSLWIARQVIRRRARFVERAKRIRFENAQLVAKFLEATEGTSNSSLGVTPFCLVKYHHKRSDSLSFARHLLRSTGVLVSPGDFFGAPKAFRMCFTGDRSHLERGLLRLADFLNSRRDRTA